MPKPDFRARHFFLNERHELPPEKSGGGSQQPFLEVDWNHKAERLTESFERIERRAAASTDPSTKGRLYIVAESVRHVTKASTAKDAVDGRKTKEVSFAGEQSQAFERLGLQLIEVFPNGTATVHAMPEQIERMRADLANQIQRMVLDPKLSSFTDDFADQWLTLRKLDIASPDPELFPDFNPELRRSMASESMLFFAEIVRKDHSVMDLLDAKFTYVNESLAKLYGIPNVRGDEFVRVDTPPNRGGVLTQASVLMLTSNATRTSPVKRGKFVLEQILNTPPPPPPPDVPALDESKVLTDHGATSRKPRLRIVPL